MQQNLFFPVYKQLEKELNELSYFITFDKKQLKTYSIKISELLLRTVSEIENISKELCKREKIKFYDKNKHIRKVVYFNDYFEKLEHIFLLSKKYVSFDLDNCNENIFELNSHPSFPFCKRVSHFESDLQILYPTFHFCNDFPVFFLAFMI